MTADLSPEDREQADTAFLVGAAYGRRAALSEAADLAECMSFPASTDPAHWASWLRSLATP